MNIFELNASEISESTGSSKFFEAGISENVTLNKVVYEPLKEGHSTWGLGVYYTNAEGDTKRLTFEYVPDPSREDYPKKVQSLLKRLTHLATKFMPREAIQISAPTFEEGFQKYAALFEGIDLSPKLRVKGVYNDKDFVVTPPYTPFVELMSTSPSLLRIEGKERVVRKPKPVVEQEFQMEAPSEW